VNSNGASAEKQSDSNGSSTTTTSTKDNTGSTSSEALGLLGSGNAADCITTSLAYAALVLEPLGFMGGAKQEDIDKFEKDTADLKAKMPSELQSDFQIVADAYKAYGDELKGLNLSDLLNPDTQKKLEAASAQLDSAEVKTAQEHIDAYFKEKCGN
jgi:hypothetical protein